MTKPAEWAPLRDAILAHLNPAKWAVALDQAKGCRNAEACRIRMEDIDVPKIGYGTSRPKPTNLEPSTSIC